jgi:uncharacterized membrane protein HdeD (DUF308 family)
VTIPESPTTPEAPSLIRDPWAPLLLAGVVTVALGVLVLAWPGPSILVASVLFGVYLVATGIAEVMFAFSGHVSAAYRVLLFIAGALSLILGVLAFRHFGQGYATLLLALWVGVGFIFQGVAATATAIGHKDLPARGWTMFFGVITAIAGVVVLAWPLGSLVVLTLVAGIGLVVIGYDRNRRCLCDAQRSEEGRAGCGRGSPPSASESGLTNRRLVAEWAARQYRWLPVRCMAAM